MPAGSADGRFQPADLLLGHLNRIEPRPGEMGRDTTDLAEREADSLEQLRMLPGKEARPVVAAVLLVAEHRQDQVTRRTEVLGARPEKRRDQHRDAGLHVEGTSTPHLAVDDGAVK